MIVYFSGTGNSQHVATRLSECLSENCIFLHPNMVLDHVQRLIFVFPIYSWGVPPYVLLCLKTLRIQPNNVKVWMVATCGDDAGLAGKMFAKAVKAKGWQYLGAMTVQMPNNYVCMKGFDTDPADVEQAKLDTAEAQIHSVISVIQGTKEEKPYLKGKFAWLKTRAVYPWFVKHAMSPTKFTATDACIGCGGCANSCPVDNIVMKDGKPSWNNDCAFCLSCYHHCPSHAIDYDNKTKNKGQYSYHENQKT